MPNNNDHDPAASTQMFQAFVQNAAPNSPTPNADTGSGSTNKVVGIVAAVAVIAVIVFLAVH